MAFFLGKRPATEDKRDLVFSLPRGVALPTVPKPGGGYGMDYGASSWLMLGNGPDDSVFPGFEGCGDCAWAGPAHEHMESEFNSRRPMSPFSGKTVVSQYSDYSGYNPQTGENDNGSDVREVLNWRQTKGLKDDQEIAHKIGTYVSITPGDLTKLWDALWIFEAVGIGVNFPGSAMDQTNSGKEWTVVSGASIEGGHYVPLVGHPSNNVWTCITWGQRQTMSGDWLAKYCDEAWAWIDAERYSQVTGETQQNFKDADLEKYISLVSAKLAA